MWCVQGLAGHAFYLDNLLLVICSLALKQSVSADLLTSGM